MKKKELEPNSLYRITNYIFTFVIESTTSYPFFTEEEINKDIQTDNKEIIKRLDEINQVISFLNILIVENFTIIELGLLDMVKIYDTNSKKEYEFRIKSEIDKFSKAYDSCSPNLRLFLKGSRKKNSH